VIVHVAHFAELDAATLYALLRLRVDVFVVEQRCAYPELDGRDVEPRTLHVWLEHDGGPAAYLRVLAEPDGTRRVGRVCTTPAHRGNQAAARLMAEALRLTGEDPCVLDAQSYLAGFYRGLGFTQAGPEYVEDGIPHIPMRRDPAPQRLPGEADPEPGDGSEP
jgi:ElaA protein